MAVKVCEGFNHPCQSQHQVPYGQTSLRCTKSWWPPIRTSNGRAPPCLTRRSTATCSANLSKQGKLALRLPAPEREAFLKKYKAKLCEAYGVVQPEYVEVPDSLLSSTQELKKFFDCSYAYVGSLKPKSTTKKSARRV
jgi:hypothetical protein